MRAVLDHRAFTLIELLVAMLMTSIIMGSTVYLFTSFIDDNRYDAFRDDAQANAQTMIDRLSRDLRSAASPTAGSNGLLAEASSYDLTFQTVSATGSAPSGNAANQMWVRYCLGSNNVLWRQTTTPSTTSSSVPSTSACPSTSSAWVQSGSQPCCEELNDVTNEIGGDTTRPLFVYGPTGESSLSQIKSVEVSLWLDKNPTFLPGDTNIISGIYLRNELEAPTANFTSSFTAGPNSTFDVALDGSTSTDPNGQVLSYQWYQGVSCPTSGAPSSGAISGATSQEYDAGDYAAGSEQFALVVTNTGGLTNCQAQTLTVP